MAKQLEVSEATCYRRRNQYGGMKAKETKELRRLADENARLKRMVPEQYNRRHSAVRWEAPSPTNPPTDLKAIQESLLLGLELFFCEDAGLSEFT